MQGSIANNYNFRKEKKKKQQLKHSILTGTGAFFQTRCAESEYKELKLYGEMENLWLPYPPTFKGKH